MKNNFLRFFGKKNGAFAKNANHTRIALANFKPKLSKL